MTNRSYFVERSSSLDQSMAFLTLAENIQGQLDWTSYIDTNALNDEVSFYRVGIWNSSYQYRVGIPK